MTPDRAEAAQLALLCLAAEGVGPIRMPAMGGPPAPVGYELIGWVTGWDALFEGWLNLDPHLTFYGWLLRKGAWHTVVLRGTQSFAEWAIDATVLPRTAHPIQGEVESGFWSLYQTLGLRLAGGTELPLVSGVAAQVAAGPLTVTGHSLGAALATYLTLELAALIRTVRGRFIASPHPGNGDFAAGFAARVRDYAAFAYADDVVPRVPLALGYQPLDNLVTLPPNPRVKHTVACQHHAGVYAWLLDGSVDAQATACVVSSPGAP
jgi:triacylglycerol lipase